MSRRCDLTFPGIGRIVKATGATTRKEYRRRVAILHELYDAGQWEALEALQSGQIRMRELVAAYRAGRLDRLLADVLLGQPLVEVVIAWLPKSAASSATRQRYGVSWASLQRALKITETTPIADLRRVDWVAVRREWPGGRHDWRHLRGMLSRFLSVHLGVDHPFRKTVIQAIPTVGTIPGRIPDLTPEAFWRIVEAMPPHVQAAPVAIVATGMRIGEYCRLQDTDLRPLTKSVRVPGTKTDRSEDVIPVHEGLWPWMERAVPCPVGTWRLRELWNRARAEVGCEGVTLHDLRHCFGQWLVAAGRPEAAVQGSLRHASAEMTRRYTLQDGRQENARVIGEIILGTHGYTHGSASRGATSA